MKRFLTLCFSLQSLLLYGLDFNKYHSQKEITDYLTQISETHTEWIRFYKLGVSDQGRDLFYVTLSNGDPTLKPMIYLNGTHHGNEKSSTETTLGVLEWFIKNKSTPLVSNLLDKYSLLVQPIVNADGHSKNTREDAFGRDPNRDYTYPGGNESNAFKIGFIGLIKDLHLKYKIRAAIAYHSGMEGVLWPWCAKNSATNLKDTFYTLAKRSAEAMGMNYYVQSYLDYPSNGEFIDFAFMKHETIGLTFEVSNAATPSTSSLNSVVERAVKGTVAFMQGVYDLDHGTLQIEMAPEMKVYGTLPLNKAFKKAKRKIE